jgi:hypothetical protein
MGKQLLLLPLQPPHPPIIDLSEKQRTAIRSVLAKAMVALVTTNDNKERSDAKRKQD